MTHRLTKESVYFPVNCKFNCYSELVVRETDPVNEYQMYLGHIMQNVYPEYSTTITNQDQAFSQHLGQKEMQILTFLCHKDVIYFYFNWFLLVFK